MYINIIIIIDYTYYYTHVDDNNNAVPPVWEIPHVTNLDGTRNYRRRADDHLSLDPREQGARPLFSLFPSEAIILYIEVYSLCIIIFVCIERRYIITPPSKSATTPGRFRHPSPTIYICMRRVPYYKSVGPPPPGVPFRDDDDYVENAARAFSFTRHRRTFLSVRAAVCTEKQDDDDDEREIQLYYYNEKEGEK